MRPSPFTHDIQRDVTDIEGPTDGTERSTSDVDDKADDHYDHNCGVKSCAEMNGEKESHRYLNI